MVGTTAQTDAALLLVVLGLAALLALAVHLGRALQPAWSGRPALPDEDCPPPGLGRLLPDGHCIEGESRRGLHALDLWLRDRRVRP